MTSARRSWIAVAAVAAVVAVVAAVWMTLPRATGTAPDAARPATPASSDAPAPAAPRAPLRLAVVGDSISAGDRPVAQPADVGELSWIHWAEDPGLEFVGGWAVPGATTAHMAENAGPVDADVLVVMAGTNDVAWGVGFAESAAHLRAIVAAVGVDRVVVAAIPPNDYAGASVTAFNAQLAAFAAENGWEYADAAASLRTSDDTFVAGTTTDGVHPTVEAARTLGEAVRAHLTP